MFSKKPTTQEPEPPLTKHDYTVDFKEAFDKNDIDGMIAAANQMSYDEVNTVEVATMYIDIFYNTLRFNKEEMTERRYNALNSRINHRIYNIPPTDKIDYDRYYLALCNYNKWDIRDAVRNREVAWCTAILKKPNLTTADVIYAMGNQIKYDINCHQDYHYNRYVQTLQETVRSHGFDRKIDWIIGNNIRNYED